MSGLFQGGVDAPKRTRRGSAREAARGDDSLTERTSLPVRPCRRCGSPTTHELDCGDCAILEREHQGLASRVAASAARPPSHALDEPDRLTALHEGPTRVSSCRMCGVVHAEKLFTHEQKNPETGRDEKTLVSYREWAATGSQPYDRGLCSDCAQLSALLVQFKQRRAMADRVRRAREVGIPPGEPIWFKDDVIVARTIVLNKHTCGKVPRNTVNIMRPGRWGNPWSHERGNLATVIVATREEAVRMHDRWIHGEVDLPGLVAPTLEEIRTVMRGRHLLCCCKPAKCHGDNYARVCA